LKEKEKIREKIYAGVNPVVLQPASDQHVLLHSSLLPTNILLINYIIDLFLLSKCSSIILNINNKKIKNNTINENK
jgi:hypothetical protein